jgi:hypothetical protein
MIAPLARWQGADVFCHAGPAELWELAERINAEGNYAAWDASTFRWQNFKTKLATMLGMDPWEQPGGDGDNLLDRPLFSVTGSPDWLANPDGDTTYDIGHIP